MLLQTLLPFGAVGAVVAAVLLALFIMDRRTAYESRRHQEKKSEAAADALPAPEGLAEEGAVVTAQAERSSSPGRRRRARLKEQEEEERAAAAQEEAAERERARALRNRNFAINFGVKAAIWVLFLVFPIVSNTVLQASLAGEIEEEGA